MPKREFQAILASVEQMAEEILSTLFDTGCDDGTPFSSNRVAAVGFTREAGSLEQAIRSTVHDIERAGYSVARVEAADEPIYSRSRLSNRREVDVQRRECCIT